MLKSTDNAPQPFTVTPTMATLLDDVPAFSPKRDFILREMSENPTLQAICKDIDAQIDQFIANPTTFVIALRHRIATEPLASRFKDQFSENEKAVLLASGGSPARYPEGPISLKRASLLHLLDVKVISTPITIGNIGQAVELATSSLRALLINFEFAKAEM
jgi:hypothetical protein